MSLIMKGANLLKQPVNPNYCATIVRLGQITDLPGCDNIKHAAVFGARVIVSKTAKTGDLGVYFPPECQLSPDFLKANGLYRPKLQLADWPKQGGFFEESGRIKTVKLRGYYSEGFWAPIGYLDCFTPEPEYLLEGATFDEIADKWVCRKYVSRRNPASTKLGQPRRKTKRDRIVAGQFREHFDTLNLKRYNYMLTGQEIVSITHKYHGTSLIVGNLLTERPLKWYEKLAKRLGVTVKEQEYQPVWSSRKVIKGVGIPVEGANHFYGSDVWGDAAKDIIPKLPKGYTVYAEIVGYTAGGSPIQKGYTYGRKSGFDVYVYRVTQTNPDGVVVDMPWKQLVQWCGSVDLVPVGEIYYGRLDKAAPAFGSTLVEKLYRHYNQMEGVDKECPFNPGLPYEGVVIRVDGLHQCSSYKLKTMAFLEHETKLLDSGVADMEADDDQTIGEDGSETEEAGGSTSAPTN